MTSMAQLDPFDKFGITFKSSELQKFELDRFSGKKSKVLYLSGKELDVINFAAEHQIGSYLDR